MEPKQQIRLLPMIKIRDYLTLAEMRQMFGTPISAPMPRHYKRFYKDPNMKEQTKRPTTIYECAEALYGLPYDVLNSEQSTAAFELAKANAQANFEDFAARANALATLKFHSSPAAAPEEPIAISREQQIDEIMKERGYKSREAAIALLGYLEQEQSKKPLIEAHSKEVRERHQSQKEANELRQLAKHDPKAAIAKRKELFIKQAEAQGLKYDPQTGRFL